MPIVKVTPEIRKEILESNENNTDLGKRLGLDKSTVKRVRKEAGFICTRKCNLDKMTAEEKNDIFNPKITFKYLVETYKRSDSYYRKFRKANGIVNEKPKPKVSKLTKKVVVNKTPVKSESKSKSRAKTKFEEEQIEREKSQKLAEKHKEAENKQKELGYRWINRIDRGIRMRVWTNK